MGSNRRLDRGTTANLVIEDLGKAEGNRSSAEAGDDARNHLAQRIQMVSAFQGHGESARAEAGRGRPGSSHAFARSPAGTEETPWRVAVVWIAPEAPQDDSRAELVDDGAHEPV